MSFLGFGKNLNFNIERNNSVHNYSFSYYDPNFIINNNKFLNNVGIGYNIKINNYIFSKIHRMNEYFNSIFGCSVFWNFFYHKNYQFNFEIGYEKTQVNADSYNVKITDVISSRLGETMHNIAEVFSQGNNNIIFIDEFDAFAKSR